MNVDEIPIKMRAKNPDASPMDMFPKEISGSQVMRSPSRSYLILPRRERSPTRAGGQSLSPWVVELVVVVVIRSPPEELVEVCDDVEVDVVDDM
jgi:hypothetical protein